MTSTSAIPTPLEDVQGDGRWLSMHHRFVSKANEMEPEVLFLGDSLIAMLQLTDLWEKWFVPMHCLNFGIGGDQTQHLLWRITNGELDCLRPKAIVILIGTNNHDHTADEVAEGIIEIFNTARAKQPQAYIIMLGIPPRGEKPNRLREKITQVNETVREKLQSEEQCQVLSLDEDFVQPDGTIDHREMFDYLHMTWQGYRKAFLPTYELLTNLLQEDALLNDTATPKCVTPSPASDNPPTTAE